VVAGREVAGAAMALADKAASQTKTRADRMKVLSERSANLASEKRGRARENTPQIGYDPAL
jgi:hypothetical protein